MHRLFKNKLDIFALVTLLVLLVYLVVHQDEEYEDPWPKMKPEDLIIPGPFPYIINEENKCAESSPFFVLLIATEVHCVDARNAIRATWGNENLIPGISMMRLFLLAKPEDDQGQEGLRAESQLYHDIIQQDFLDAYNNLTLKTLLGINWVAMYCPQARYVMKTDSDMFINTKLLIKAVLRPDQEPKSKYYTGMVNIGVPSIRNPFNKWYMPYELFPDTVYPPYCSGNGYVFSGDLARGVYAAALKTRYIHFEDVFVGICMSRLGVRPTLPPAELKFLGLREKFSPSCARRYLVTSHAYSPKQLLEYWQELQNSQFLICEKILTDFSIRDEP